MKPPPPAAAATTTMTTTSEQQHVLGLWRKRPINARSFASFIPIPGLSAFKVEQIIRKSEEYSLLAEGNKKKPRHRPKRYINAELKRGSLVFVDSAYMTQAYIPFKFVIVARDWYSKLTYFQGASTLTASAVVDAFRAILKRANFRVKTVLTDLGTEYCNAQFEALLKSIGANHTYAGASFENKACGAERAIRYLRPTLERLRMTLSTNNLKILLPRLEAQYNSSTNDRTKLSPNETTNEASLYILQRMQTRRHEQNINRDVDPKFKLKQLVRLKLKRSSVFSKSSQPQYSSNCFVVKKIKFTLPEVSYKLQSSDGTTLPGTFPQSRLRSGAPTVTSGGKSSILAKELTKPPIRSSNNYLPTTTGPTTRSQTSRSVVDDHTTKPQPTRRRRPPPALRRPITRSQTTSSPLSTTTIPPMTTRSQQQQQRST